MREGKALILREKIGQRISLVVRCPTGRGKEGGEGQEEGKRRRRKGAYEN